VTLVKPISCSSRGLASRGPWILAGRQASLDVRIIGRLTHENADAAHLRSLFAYPSANVMPAPNRPMNCRRFIRSSGIGSICGAGQIIRWVCWPTVSEMVQGRCHLTPVARIRLLPCGASHSPALPAASTCCQTVYRSEVSRSQAATWPKSQTGRHCLLSRHVRRIRGYATP
jgi:hypothetical protein